MVLDSTRYRGEGNESEVSSNRRTAQHRLQRTAAPPLMVRTWLARMRENEWAVARRPGQLSSAVRHTSGGTKPMSRVFCTGCGSGSLDWNGRPRQ